MKIGDRVEFLVYRDSDAVSAVWDTGYEVEMISSKMALVKRNRVAEFDGEYWLRKCVPLSRLRECVPLPPREEFTYEMPELGAGVLYRVPHNENKPWAFGTVVKHHKKSVTVLAQGRLLQRKLSLVITVPSPEAAT